MRHQENKLNYMETWIDVAGYEGLYMVSSNGLIRSYKRGFSIKNGSRNIGGFRLIKQERTRLGYMRVGLSKNGIRKRILVHVIVANNFLTRVENKEVNHIDSDKTNNNVGNLEFVTKSENIIHSYKTGLRKRAIQKKRSVTACYNNTVKIFDGIIDAANYFKTSTGNIHVACSTGIKVRKHNIYFTNLLTK